MRSSGARGKPLAGAGTLGMAAAVSMGVGTTPKGIHVLPGGAYAYAALSGSAAIAQFTRDGGGALTAFATRDKATGAGPAYFASATTGSTSLYVTSSGTYRLYGYQVAAGVLTLANALNLDTAAPVGNYPQGMCVAPGEAFIYIAYRNPSGPSGIMQCSRNTGTGVTALLSPSHVLAGGSFGTMDVKMTQLDTGLFLYSANFNGDTIQIWNRNAGTGQLTAHGTMPSIGTGAGTAPCFMWISPDDKHLYVALDGSSQVAAYTINGDGTLTLINKYTAGSGPYSCTGSSDGLHVFVGSSDGQTIYQYTRNASTGVLTAKVPAFVRSDPNFTAITGSAGPQSLGIYGNSLYASGSISPSMNVVQFNIHA